jgi:hypothetical protein
MLWAAVAAAQVKTYRLEPKQGEQFPWASFAGVRGTVGDEPHRYLLEKLSILQPVSVAVRTLEPENQINLTVHKFTWDQPERSLTTDESGVAIVNFRTEGEFQFQLTADGDPAPYQVLVMVGEEVPPVMPRVVLTQDEYDEWQPAADSESMSIDWWKIALVGLLAAILVVLFTISRRLGGNRKDA